MTHEAQRRVVQTIPGLSRARILRYGSIHRNMYVDLPRVCSPYQRDRKVARLFYAGQICGVEGYVECIASGLIAALSVYAEVRGRALPELPGVTMTGSLMNHVHTPARNFQPMNANMGLLPPAPRVRGGRKRRYLEFSRRAEAAMRSYRGENAWLFDTGADRPDPL
jgi:methylenetetrahydrofolate--tRNA-(uracil-5-)-methyltransferase